MIDHLEIKNYKSIKDISLDAKRVNIFIGEHNSGKSNILEALSWLSTNSLSKEIMPEVFRFKSATDFFYDFDATQPIEIKTSSLSLVLKYAKNAQGALQNELQGLIYPTTSGVDPIKEADWELLERQLSEYYSFTLTFDGEIRHAKGILSTKFRTYIFKKLREFKKSHTPFLNPPFGENIPSLLISNRNYKELVSAIFKEKGFRLMLKPNEDDINMAKDVHDELYAYPYTTISETLQRIVFYILAIESNKDSILILDEPESNTFPMYTKQLAELIALDDSNQYFIATHDPYLLSSLVSKTPSNDISIFITRMDDYETSITRVDQEQLSKVLDQGMDIYFNLNKFISE